MSRLRTAVLGGAVWCAVVALVASLVWVVIDRAGHGVIPEAQPQADVTGSLPVPGGRRAGPDPSVGPTLEPRPSRRTTAPPPLTSTSSSPTGAPPPAAPVRQRRSWSGAAGHVVAECRGSAVRLVSTFPGSGWRYTILDRGPAQVGVRFQRLGEDHFVTVVARCAGGAPRFAASDGQPGDD